MNVRREAPPLRVGIAQFQPRKAELDANLERIAGIIAERGPEHDVLVFPETAPTGYFLEGGVAEVAVAAADLAAALGSPGEEGPDVVVGFYERWRRNAYNSVGYFSPGADGGYEPVHIHRKMFLPTYGVFDEDRFVEAGRDMRAFDTRFGRMGMLVCEEMWHSLPPTILAVDGAELLLVVSASPARDFSAGHSLPGNLVRWNDLVRGVAMEHGIFVVSSQLVGSEGGKLFLGGSSAVGPDGEELARAPLREECVTSVALEGAAVERARLEAPLLADLERNLPHLRAALDAAVRRSAGLPDGAADEVSDGLPDRAGEGQASAPGTGLRGNGAGTLDSDERRETVSAAASDGALDLGPAPLSGRDPDRRPDAGPAPGDVSILDMDLPLVEQTLVDFIQDEVIRRRGFEKVVVGVSGGVDSSVSLFLAVKALGPENVYAFRLPYRTSSQESLDHADMVIEASGAHGRTIEITGPVDSYVEEYEPDLSPTRRGNLCARVRSLLLFDLSAKHHALPLGTGNKSERLLGYYTWHADDSPPINPLGDLFKTQVWALARRLDVPDAIVEKPATADLVEGVTDQDELGVSYHDADPILYWILKGYHPEDLVRRGFSKGPVELVWNRLHSTHWKRELPTVAVLSSSAIGEFYLRPVDY